MFTSRRKTYNTIASTAYRSGASKDTAAGFKRTEAPITMKISAQSHHHKMLMAALGASM
jgi:hypothetical protein